jgi:hypothetical protein
MDQSDVTAAWVIARLRDNDLRQAELCNALKISRFTLSKLLSGNFNLTNWHKAAFYYYFQYHENLKHGTRGSRTE